MYSVKYVFNEVLGVACASHATQQTTTCSKATIETLEKGVKNVQS